MVAARLKRHAARIVEQWSIGAAEPGSTKWESWNRRFAELTPGSRQWLVWAERKYGGYAARVPRTRVSVHDPRSADQLARGGMIGGDRMSLLHHGYARRYEAALKPFVGRAERIALVEVGILKGTGLAIWSDLFPNARVIGLDIDLEHTRANMPNLRARGAFANANVELHEFDQLDDERDQLTGILGGDRISIAIDDGLHTDAAVLNTFRALRPHLAERFVYLVEDNATVHAALRRQPGLEVENHGEFTVIRPAGV